MTPASGALQHDQEIELKLALEAAQLVAFKRLMSRRRVAPTTHHLSTCYFDTPDFALSDLGLDLRLRRVGRRWIQTLKSKGEHHGGLWVRAEYETPVSGDTLDFSRFPPAALALIPEPLIPRLAPMFETRFTRTAWLVRTRSRAKIEVALDSGEIRAGANTHPLCEVELELKSGRAEALLEWALTLTKQIKLLPQHLSKAERGMQLARGTEAAPARAGAIKLGQEMTVEDGFIVVCRTCLAQFQANLQGVLREDDPEYLHQARVALRRLRAALRLFRRVCPLKSVELQQSLRSWNAALGPARDWDVLCLDTLPPIAPHFPATQAWAHFAAAADSQRQCARQAMRTTLMESNPGRVVLQFQQWLMHKTWRDTVSDPRQDKVCLQPLSHFARRALRTGRRKIRDMAQDFGELTPDARHALRILIKRQRYAVEFFKSLHVGAKGKSYLNALVIAQDSLGRGNDAHVATRLLEPLTETEDKSVAAFVSGWLAHATIQRDDPAFERALKKLS